MINEMMSCNENQKLSKKIPIAKLSKDLPKISVMELAFVVYSVRAKKMMANVRLRRRWQINVPM